ncbi:G2/mitotic-specific cyclin-A-like [Sitophilus oryzae]|uniref:G2/mitotic-specific cyclin-A-like n=1 Tax=Sitophilus oryzae TaxID=7048 RepID=A0A6J2YKD5_SITOR|nr:G2/mitotic-specific cyclin-A-like [Sitophilus oryzae]
MASFGILEDNENNDVKCNKRLKKSNKPNEQVFQKKGVVSNRGVLRTLKNGVRADVKTIHEKEQESRIEELVSLDDSLKENEKINNLDADVLEGKGNENEDHLREEENMPKRLLYVAEYRKDIWKHLHNLERTYSFPKSKYMLKQSDLTWNTRSILIDWLSSVSEEYKLCTETFHLSVNYIDRFLSHIAVVRSKFQLVGAAAMLLAGKIEEIYPIDVKEWSYLTGDTFTPRQILKMEQLIAKILRFRMQPPTMYTFIEHFCHEHRLDAQTMHLAMYISELVLLEGDEYLNHLPSKLAAASIVVARYTLSEEQVWPSKFKESSGYTLQQLSPLVKKQHETFKDSPLKEQQAIQTKYKNEKYFKVALVKPKNLLIDYLEESE